MNTKTAERIDNINKTIADMNNMSRLYSPLATLLLGECKKLDIEGVPRFGRTVNLNKDDYDKQYEAGINRVVGFDIQWV